MATGLWGKKIGMTQVFSDENAAVPVTAVDVSGWFVTNVRTKERDGYDAIQVGCVKDKYLQKKFEEAWLKKPKQYFYVLKEIRLSEPAGDSFAIGKSADFLSFLKEGDSVDVFGRSKGCGFAGVLRRHNFAGDPGSHGSTMGNRTGSLGFMATQGHVIKGKKMPGHMGNKNRVAKNLEVIKIEPESKLVFVKGSIPGKSGSFVFLRSEKVS